MTERMQLTTDGHKPYLEAVEESFGADIDYAVLVKHYGPAPDADQSRYSPDNIVGLIDAAAPKTGPRGPYKNRTATQT